MASIYAETMYVGVVKVESPDVEECYPAAPWPMPLDEFRSHIGENAAEWAPTRVAPDLAYQKGVRCFDASAAKYQQGDVFRCEVLVAGGHRQTWLLRADIPKAKPRWVPAVVWAVVSRAVNYRFHVGARMCDRRRATWERVSC